MASTIANTEDENNSGEGRRPPGEFDEDETEDVIAQVKAKKSTTFRPTGNSVSVSRPTSTTRALGTAGPSQTTNQVCH